MEFLLIFVIFAAVFLAIVLAFFALSSCLGDEIRAAWSGGRARRAAPTTYGLQYAQLMGSGGHSGGGYSEHIEMEDMLNNRRMMDDRRED